MAPSIRLSQAHGEGTMKLPKPARIMRKQPDERFLYVDFHPYKRQSQVLFCRAKLTDVPNLIVNCQITIDEYNDSSAMRKYAGIIITKVYEAMKEEEQQ